MTNVAPLSPPQLEPKNLRIECRSRGRPRAVVSLQLCVRASIYWCTVGKRFALYGFQSRRLLYINHSIKGEACNPTTSNYQAACIGHRLSSAGRIYRHSCPSGRGQFSKTLSRLPSFVLTSLRSWIDEQSSASFGFLFRGSGRVHLPILGDGLPMGCKL